MTTLLAWWLGPPDPADADPEARKKELKRGVKTYLLLALLMLYFTWHAVGFYCVWLLVAWMHGAFQYRFAFASMVDRPPLYEQTVELLLLSDIVSHIALAGFSSIGWWAVAPLALAWLHFGRTVGRLALSKEMENIRSLVRQDYPADTIADQERMTRRLFRERLELPAD